MGFIWDFLGKCVRFFWVTYPSSKNFANLSKWCALNVPNNIKIFRKFTIFWNFGTSTISWKACEYWNWKIATNLVPQFFRLFPSLDVLYDTWWNCGKRMMISQDFHIKHDCWTHLSTNIRYLGRTLNCSSLYPY